MGLCSRRCVLTIPPKIRIIRLHGVGCCLFPKKRHQIFQLLFQVRYMDRSETQSNSSRGSAWVVEEAVAIVQLVVSALVYSPVRELSVRLPFLLRAERGGLQCFPNLSHLLEALTEICLEEVRGGARLPPFAFFLAAGTIRAPAFCPGTVRASPSIGCRNCACCCLRGNGDIHEWA